MHLSTILSHAQTADNITEFSESLFQSMQQHIPSIQALLVYSFDKEQQTLRNEHVSGQPAETTESFIRSEQNPAFFADIMASDSVLSRQGLVQSHLFYQAIVPLWIGQDFLGLIVVESDAQSHEAVQDACSQIAPISACFLRMMLAQQELTHLKRVIDQHILMADFDQSGEVHEVSDAMVKLLGINPGQADQVSQCFDHKPTTQWLQRLRSGEEFPSQEIQYIDHSGDVVWTRMSAVPRYNIRDEIVGMTSVFHNITDVKTLEEYSTRDELTKLYNRRFFNSNFAEELKRCQRYGSLFCFLLLDVDHFKKYNDTYGHPAGDHVLAQVASALNMVFQRPEDHCFRLGGEEFGVTFSTQGEEDAQLLAEAARQTIEALDIEHSGNAPSQIVTASFGLIVVSPSQPVDIEDVYKTTDEALYRAKHNGRNRVELVTSEVELF